MALPLGLTPLLVPPVTELVALLVPLLLPPEAPLVAVLVPPLLGLEIWLVVPLVLELPLAPMPLPLLPLMPPLPAPLLLAVVEVTKPELEKLGPVVMVLVELDELVELGPEGFGPDDVDSGVAVAGTPVLCAKQEHALSTESTAN